ncbi:uncharacterized protein [Drosophila kikkawai]|uniref:Uncharacterized protein n=1 Tax=Drosophila kikkawai TaxID=30033 RepID=A0ABM4GPQ0_DROKI
MVLASRRKYSLNVWKTWEMGQAAPRKKNSQSQSLTPCPGGEAPAPLLTTATSATTMRGALKRKRKLKAVIFCALTCERSSQPAVSPGYGRVYLVYKCIIKRAGRSSCSSLDAHLDKDVNVNADDDVDNDKDEPKLLP